EHHQIQNRAHSADSPRHIGRFLHEQRENQIPNARESYLPSDGAERIGRRSLPLFREHRTKRPTDRSQWQRERPPEFAMAEGIRVLKVRPDEHNHPSDSDHEADLAPPRDMMIA